MKISIRTTNRPLLVSILLISSIWVASCEVKFIPDIDPLLLPTAPPSDFGELDAVEADAQPLEVEATPISPLDPGFDPEDPQMWIDAIESRWPLVDVVTCELIEMAKDCKPWTARELGLLYDTLEEYILSEYIDREILFIRSDSSKYSGLSEPWSDNYGNPYGRIYIADQAWISPPAAALYDIFDVLFKKPERFKGTIAHELTHAAVWFHPELLEWWLAAKEAQGIDWGTRNWRLGLLYAWGYYDELRDDPELYQTSVEGELFAMAVSALMYDPTWGKSIE